MNERIQTLAVQAEDYADSIVDQGGEFHPAYTQKLAELIVKECIDIVDKVYDDQTGMGAKMCRRATPYQEIINEIEEHFGVEE